MGELSEGLVYYAVFLFSTTLHEAAHAWAAKRGGDLTAYLGGQVTLDPMPHIRREPVGMVILPLLSVFVSGWPFGFASAPYDRRWAERYPKRAAWMALAGPASNLVLVLLAGTMIMAGVLAGVFAPPESITFGHITASTADAAWGDAVAFLVGAFFSLNLLLFVLNMLPIPPLDGSGALPLIMTDDMVPRYQAFVWGQRGFALIGIFLAWQVFDFVFGPVFLTAVGLLYPGVSYQ